MVSTPIGYEERLFLSLFFTIAMMVVIAAFSVYALRNVIQAMNVVAFDYAEDVTRSEAIRADAQQTVATGRAYLLTGDIEFLTRLKTARQHFVVELSALKHDMSDDPYGERIAGEIEGKATSYGSLLDRAIARKQAKAPVRSLIRFFETEMQPKREDLDRSISALIDHNKARLIEASQRSAKVTSHARTLLILITAISVSLASLLSIFGGRTLARLYREAREATVLREDTLAIVSHDLKTPLSVILLSTELLQKTLEESSPEKIRKLLDRIAQSAKGMGHLISDLLDLSRLEASKFPITIQPWKVNDLFDEALAMISPLAVSRGIALEKRPLEGNATTYCDRDRILQVFSNLIGNAIKYTPSGGTITVTSEIGKEGMRFSVRDTGQGIPPSILPLLFDRYRQARDSEHKSGSGLGLFIAKGIVEAHGGRIWIESKEGSGTTVSFTLPPTSSI